jgi:hypothetical protein
MIIYSRGFAPVAANRSTTRRKAVTSILQVARSTSTSSDVAPISTTALAVATNVIVRHRDRITRTDTAREQRQVKRRRAGGHHHRVTNANRFGKKLFKLADARGLYELPGSEDLLYRRQLDVIKAGIRNLDRGHASYSVAHRSRAAGIGRAGVPA